MLKRQTLFHVPPRHSVEADKKVHDLTNHSHFGDFLTLHSRSLCINCAVMTKQESREVALPVRTRTVEWNWCSECWVCAAEIFPHPPRAQLLSSELSKQSGWKLQMCVRFQVLVAHYTWGSHAGLNQVKSQNLIRQHYRHQSPEMCLPETGRWFDPTANERRLNRCRLWWLTERK